MNGRDTVLLKGGGAPYRVRFLGAGAGAGLAPFVGAFDVEGMPAGERREVRVALGLNFLWSADAAIDADESAERIMRTVGLLCVEAHLAGRLEPGRDGTLQIRDFIGTRYPDYTSVEMFVASLSEPTGRTDRMCREDLLRCLAEHAQQKRSQADPTGPGLTVAGFLAWPGKRRFYADESVRDAILAWEGEDLVETIADRARIRSDRLDEVRGLLG
ncbi:MAG TPA: hypothetical protein VM431_11855 [Phycisphaerae bacterium]|nr:hypothetical protein [Phycisphaerae bacterium]